MRRAIVGTAGHIDHGKTSLVEALTGTHCDRFPEEKRRGITIDIGFAHLREGDLQLGFVDVPGHEKFVGNALAGLGGIRVLMLVVAADEGVKQQTREHLDIVSLLKLPAAVVALTKVDLVDPELAELAALELEDLLATTPYAGAEIVPVSSLTGQGIPELKARLVELASRFAVPDAPDLPARLPVDRAFHLKGLGVVVTGTLSSGAIAVGDELEVLPEGLSVRVRDVQVHGEPRDRAFAGERTSLRLTGVELTQMGRGVEIVSPGAFAATKRLLVRFRLLPDAGKSIQGFVSVRTHLFAAESIGRLRPLSPPVLEPGAEGIAEIRLAAPLVAARGDRWIGRRPSPATTWGGGEVLDPFWPRHRGEALEKALASLTADREAAVDGWIREAGEAGVTARGLAQRLGEPVARLVGDLEARVARDQLLSTPASAGGERRYVAPAAYRRVAQRAEKMLGALLSRDRLVESIPKAEALKRLFPGRGAALGPLYLDWLAAQKKLVIEGGQVRLPGREAQLSTTESALAVEITARFEAGGLKPPSPGELVQDLRAKPQIVDGVIRYLIERGKLVKLPDGLILAAAAVTRLRADLLATGWQRFSVPQFKDHFALSRKWAIPLLEHLDSVGATKRAGAERLVVKP